MSRRAVHFEVEILFDALYVPLCENQADRDPFTNDDTDVEMTQYVEEVTCKRCIKALGYEATAPDCQPDPLPRAA